MIASIGQASVDRVRMTVHAFEIFTLIGNSQTDISWWNKNDHTQKFPWDFSRIDPPPGLSPLVWYTNIDFQLTDFNNFQQDKSYFIPNLAAPTPTDGLKLMAVDEDGVDLFDFFDGSLMTRAQRINGIYVKQYNVAHETIVRVFENLVIVWVFADQDGNRIAPRG